MSQSSASSTPRISDRRHRCSPVRRRRAANASHIQFHVFSLRLTGRQRFSWHFDGSCTIQYSQTSSAAGQGVARKAATFIYKLVRCNGGRRGNFLIFKCSRRTDRPLVLLSRGCPASVRCGATSISSGNSTVVQASPSSHKAYVSARRHFEAMLNCSSQRAIKRQWSDNVQTFQAFQL